MRKIISLVVALTTVAFVMVATSAAAPPTTHGPYNITTPDGGCAGNTWANDTVARTWKVKKGPDVSGQPTWRVTRIDRGTFTTVAGTSPGNCAANTGPHGTTVVANVVGKVHGRLSGTVTGGTYNPSATCGNECGTTTTFISTYFGASAHYTCIDGYAGCKFNFNYRATTKGLLYNHWTDKDNGGTGEIFTGDIASS